MSHTLADLKERGTAEDEYKRLGLAGVLRRTLLDQHAVALVARDRKTRLEFKFRPAQVVAVPEGAVFGLWLPDPGQFRVPEVSGGLKQFRDAPIASASGHAITVGDLVKYFAHVEGGVHIGHPDGVTEEMMRAIFSFRSDGWRHGLDLLADIAYVAFDGLKSLIDADDEASAGES